VKRLGAAMLAAWAFAAALAPWLSPNDPRRQFDSRVYAPPSRLHVFDGSGRLTMPYFYAHRLENPLERRYTADREHAVPLRWLGRRLVRAADDAQPLFLLGGDSLGRDLFSRLLHGARTSLALALIAACAATAIGAVAGGAAGLTGGILDTIVTRTAEFVMALPTLYVLLALRAVLPLVVPPWEIFLLTAAIFALVGWPLAARGVRAIVAAERQRDYAEAAVALGATTWRVLWRHLLPATAGFVSTQFTLFLPACILAEATLSFAGLGFPDDLPSWGTLLQDAANVGVLATAPWLLAPAAAIFSVVAAVNLAVESAGTPATLI
jgi:peptide/nickel transport system permease protein